MGRSGAAGRVEELRSIAAELAVEVDRMRFSPPVAFVYNPLSYARSAYSAYVGLCGGTTGRILLLGMNPGPYGMVQTGVPFGDVEMVRGWLGIEAPVGHPVSQHPRRPVLGFACRRREVSGRRLWGWARAAHGTPGSFFEKFVVLNYCPLAFVEASGRNRTPDHLPVAERLGLFAACDRALVRTCEILRPGHVVGIGRFAEHRANEALAALGIPVSGAPHPSPANPAANRGWETLMESALHELVGRSASKIVF